MPQVHFQIMSDLHLETPLARPTYEDFAASFVPRSPYLALLGDIGYIRDARLFQFLERQLHLFQIVFFLLGNHEPYGMSFLAAKSLVAEFAARMDEKHNLSEDIGRFIFLDQIRCDIDERTTVLGCTLFSQISKKQAQTVTMFVTDFSNIENWKIDDHNKAHESDLNWLNTQVEMIAEEEPHRQIVIFTHYSPTFLETATDPAHKDDSAQVTSAFATDLSDEICWRNTQVKIWAFGHTHFNCDFEDPHTKKRVIANQKGYRRAESITFDAEKIVYVEQCSPSCPVQMTAEEGQSSRRKRFRHRSTAQGCQKACMIM